MIQKKQLARVRETYSGSDDLAVMQLAFNYNNYLRQLVTRHITQRQNVLDFGAGLGTFAIPLSKSGYQITCVEIDPVFRAKLEAEGVTVHSYLEDVPENAFDAIYSLNVIEHIEDDLGALKTLRDKLKRDGTLLLYVPAFQFLFSSMDRKVGHFRRYKRSQLAQLVEDAGFDVETVRYADSMGFFATLLFKYVGNPSGDTPAAALKIFDSFVFPISRLLDRFLWPLLGKNTWVIAHNRR